MKLVPLTKGFFAKVDDEDFDRVIQFKWQAITYKNRSNLVYARRSYGPRSNVRSQYMHQLITGANGMHDHIDGDGLNNQSKNIRLCNHITNGQNQKVQKHSSPYKGVSFWDGAWKSKICVNKKQINIGMFAEEKDAALAYDAAAIKHFGIYARTNQQLGLLHEIR